MSAELQRITTQYVDSEDRIRLSGELVGGQTVVLWLTQRLLNRLVPPLTQWLEERGNPTYTDPSVQAVQKDILLGFAQSAARARLAPEPPVQAKSPQAVWRVASVDLARGPDKVVLTFKGEESEPVALKLTIQPLRQWLGIVQDQYRKADWPLEVWPGWMEESVQPARQAGVALH